MRLRCIYEACPGANFLKYRTISIVFLCLVLRFANTITYSNEYNLCDCSLGSAEPLGLEPLGPELAAEGLVDMSHSRGATRLELVDKSLDRLMAEMQCWSQLLLNFSEETLFNKARKILSNQYDCINQT